MKIKLLIKNHISFKILYPIARFCEKVKKNNSLLYKNIMEELKKSGDLELISYAKLMKQRGYLSDFNGKWTKKYNFKTSEVFRDGEMYYVMYQGLSRKMRMYFHGDRFSAYFWDYAIRLQEDKESPHKYFSKHICSVLRDNEPGGTILDLGAAEGFFSIAVIDYIDKAYLFEADVKWNRAISRTFHNEKDKVVVVNKYVSDTTEGEYISIDDYFGVNIPLDIRLIKIDIEGFEQRALNGMKKTLEMNPQAILLVCAYHKLEAEREIKEILEPMGYRISRRKGRMLFVQDTDDRFPYVRHGVLEAERVL